MLFLNPLSKIAIVQQKSATALTGPLAIAPAIQHILKVRGPIGFYDGLVPSMVREGYKTSYKGMLQVNANDFAIGLIPETSTGAYFLRGGVAGSIVGTVDSILVAPFERYRTYRISQDTPGNFFTYIKNINAQQPQASGFISELYRGLGVTIGKQSLMNISFFSTKAWANRFAKPYEKTNPISTIAFSSLMSGLGAALMGAPLDIVKTLKQQQTSINISTKLLLKEVYKRSGWRGLVVGVPARFVLISTAYGLNGLFLNLFEKVRQKNQKPEINHDLDALNQMTEKMGSLSINNEEEPVSVIIQDKTYLPSRTEPKIDHKIDRGEGDNMEIEKPIKHISKI